MDAGEMTARLVLKRKVATRDDMGGEQVTFPTVTSVAAKAEPIRGREYVALQQAQSDTEIRFTIYYRADIRADWRVEWRSQDYEIVGPPIDVGARRQYLELMCRTAQT
jgi:SPP1 family predicted phage head-tail adaptor